MVAPLTTDVEQWQVSPLCRVIIPATETGLDVESAAMCDNTTNVEKKRLKGEPIGRVSQRYLDAIEKGRQVAVQNKPSIQFYLFGR